MHKERAKRNKDILICLFLQRTSKWPNDCTRGMTINPFWDANLTNVLISFELKEYVIHFYKLFPNLWLETKHLFKVQLYLFQRQLVEALKEARHRTS